MSGEEKKPREMQITLATAWLLSLLIYILNKYISAHGPDFQSDFHLIEIIQTFIANYSFLIRLGSAKM